MSPRFQTILTAPKFVNLTSRVKRDRPAVTGRANIKAASMVFDGKQKEKK